MIGLILDLEISNPWPWPWPPRSELLLVSVAHVPSVQTPPDLRSPPFPPTHSLSTCLHVVRAMSLNGLENPVIVEAYQSALADAGGW